MHVKGTEPLRTSIAQASFPSASTGGLTFYRVQHNYLPAGESVAPWQPGTAARALQEISQDRRCHVRAEHVEHKEEPEDPYDSPNYHKQRLELLPYLVPSLLACLFRRRDTTILNQVGTRAAKAAKSSANDQEIPRGLVLSRVRSYGLEQLAGERREKDQTYETGNRG